MEKLKQKSHEKEQSRLYKEEIASIEETDTAGEIVIKPRNKKQLEFRSESKQLIQIVNANPNGSGVCIFYIRDRYC